jgi:hypothetical protein
MIIRYLREFYVGRCVPTQAKAASEQEKDEPVAMCHSRQSLINRLSILLLVGEIWE